VRSILYILSSKVALISVSGVREIQWVGYSELRNGEVYCRGERGGVGNDSPA